MKRKLPFDDVSDLQFFDGVAQYAIMPSVYAGSTYMVRKFDGKGASWGCACGTLTWCVQRLKEIRMKSVDEFGRIQKGVL